MKRLIILDTGPLSNCVVEVAKPFEVPKVSQQCRQWIDDCEKSGISLLVPAVAYYEALRELELRSASSQIARLKGFCLRSDRFIPLRTDDLEAAARLWANARKSGKSTASPHSLDADVIIAAQALSLGLAASDFIIATTNPGHIARFAPCDLWTNIAP